MGTTLITATLVVGMVVFMLTPLAAIDAVAARRRRGLVRKLNEATVTVERCTAQIESLTAHLQG